MRITIAIALALCACSKGENAGVEEAKKQPRKELKHKEKAPNAVAKKISPPVPGRAKLNCAAVIDADKFTQELGETAPVTVAESKSEPEAAASCSLVRGGKRLS